MTAERLSLAHTFIPPQQSGLPTLLMLHGTGGDENDLLPLGAMLLPGAGMLSPRGAVRENGMPRFFRRLAEGVFDLDDLHVRTHELADFVESAASVYGFDPVKVIAVGYSNGANIAASVLLTRPGVLHGAVLLHAMVPFEPQEQPELSGTSVLITGGRQDPMAPPSSTERLADLLRTAGADVSLHWSAGGHSLVQSEVEAAQLWIGKVIAST